MNVFHPAVHIAMLKHGRAESEEETCGTVNVFLPVKHTGESL